MNRNYHHEINKRVKAFTIAELVVVMVLSGIVITSAYLLLEVLQKQMVVSSQRESFHSEIQRFNSVLHHDLQQSERIEDKKGLQFFYQNREVRYYFNADHTVRKTSKLEEVFNIEVKLLEIIELDEYNYLPGELHIYIRDFNENEPLIITKSYCADDLFRNYE